ncbi:copper amine oxidase N-terminal domain-containing protein [Pelotomaculum terephthalicicum JT]|uniref:copper amine oxidase N-terminal domain-containing protein n=1 Tax=Pelotomaculum terephthalicicum TaxID=206393 RepID=UPI001F042405|nr:copper amine oxidase N-terminal domain-containing protein [Pelotomaculum terephthalicicum]MCG9967939.1 copper amine oxidase N-terminal domain-containing protein [Pelotomaculum terephthalicicum JT]
MQAFAESVVYKPVTVKVVKDNKVNELGSIFAKFPAGRLQKYDIVIFRLPSGFIWTTTDLDSNKNAAARSAQTTEQWNSIVYDSDFIKYGTKNYILVPSKDSGNDNGFYQGNKPILSFTSLNEREVRMEVIGEPDPQEECYFYLYPKRIFVAGGDAGDIGITIDIPDDPDYATNNNADVNLECTDAVTVYAGLKGQKIGVIKLTKNATSKIINGTTFTLQLPPNVRWEKLGGGGGNEIKVAGSVSDDGRTAEFKFLSSYSSAASLELKDMEVSVEPGLTGELKVQIGGTAGLTGELSVADIVKPNVAFTIGQDKFLLDGKEQQMDIAPYVKNDRTYLPVRYIATALGIADSDINWYNDEQCVVIVRESGFIKFVIGSKEMIVNGKSVVMDVEPEFVEPGRVMLPLRWVAQAFGANIIWDEKSETAIIKK